MSLIKSSGGIISRTLGKKNKTLEEQVKDPTIGTSLEAGVVGGSNGVLINGTNTAQGGPIGEVVQASNSSTTLGSSNVWKTLEVITLDEGVWFITASLGLQLSGTWTRIIGAISLTANDFDDFRYRVFTDSPTGAFWNQSPSSRILAVDAPTSVYLTANVSYTGTVSIYQAASLQAIRER